MDHNQTVTDQYLQKFLATESRIIAVDLYEAIKTQLNPALELAEFRVAIKEWFNGPLNQYESVKGRFGGIRLVNETNRAARSIKPEECEGLNDNPSSEQTTDPEAETDNEGLIVYLSPSVRVHQPDSRNWAIQKRNGDVWVSQYYQNTLDDIIASFIRRALNNEFRASNEKITDLKEVVKLVRTVQSELNESFKAMIVQKTSE